MASPANGSASPGPRQSVAVSSAGGNKITFSKGPAPSLPPVQPIASTSALVPPPLPPAVAQRPPPAAEEAPLTRTAARRASSSDDSAARPSYREASSDDAASDGDPPSFAGAGPSNSKGKGVLKMERKYEELEDIVFSNPRSFTAMVFDIAEARGQTLFVSDDRTNKQSSAYMHITCAHRRSGCPFILKLTRAKEGGWILKAAQPQPGEADVKARSTYNCVHPPGSVPDAAPLLTAQGTVMPVKQALASNKAVMSPSPAASSSSFTLPPIAIPSVAQSKGKRKGPASKKHSRDGSAGSPAPYDQQVEPVFGKLVPSRDTRAANVQERGSMNSSQVLGNMAKVKAPPIEDRALAPPFERSLSLQAKIQPVLSYERYNTPHDGSMGLSARAQAFFPTPALQPGMAAPPQPPPREQPHGRSPYQVPPPGTHSSPYSSMQPQAGQSSGLVHPSAPQQYTAGPYQPSYRHILVPNPPSAPAPPRPSLLPTSSSLSAWTHFIKALDPTLLGFAAILAAPTMALSPESFFAESMEMRLALIDVLEVEQVGIWPRLKLKMKVKEKGEQVWKEVVEKETKRVEAKRAEQLAAKATEDSLKAKAEEEKRQADEEQQLQEARATAAVEAEAEVEAEAAAARVEPMPMEGVEEQGVAQIEEPMHGNAQAEEPMQSIAPAEDPLPPPLPAMPAAPTPVEEQPQAVDLIPIDPALSPVQAYVPLPEPTPAVGPAPEPENAPEPVVKPAESKKGKGVKLKVKAVKQPKKSPARKLKIKHSDTSPPHAEPSPASPAIASPVTAQPPSSPLAPAPTSTTSNTVAVFKIPTPSRRPSHADAAPIFVPAVEKEDQPASNSPKSEAMDISSDEEETPLMQLSAASKEKAALALRDEAKRTEADGAEALSEEALSAQVARWVSSLANATSKEVAGRRLQLGWLRDMPFDERRTLKRELDDYVAAQEALDLTPEDDGVRYKMAVGQVLECSARLEKTYLQRREDVIDLGKLDLTYEVKLEAAFPTQEKKVTSTMDDGETRTREGSVDELLITRTATPLPPSDPAAAPPPRATSNSFAPPPPRPTSSSSTTIRSSVNGGETKSGPPSTEDIKNAAAFALRPATDRPPSTSPSLTPAAVTAKRARSPTPPPLYPNVKPPPPPAESAGDKVRRELAARQFSSSGTNGSAPAKSSPRLPAGVPIPRPTGPPVAKLQASPPPPPSQQRASYNGPSISSSTITPRASYSPSANSSIRIKPPSSSSSSSSHSARRDSNPSSKPITAFSAEDSYHGIPGLSPPAPRGASLPAQHGAPPASNGARYASPSGSAPESGGGNAPVSSRWAAVGTNTRDDQFGGGKRMRAD